MLATKKAGLLPRERGEKISQKAINRAKKFIKISPNLAHRYLISPNPDGCVSLEFFQGGWNKCLEFSSKGVDVFCFGLGKKLDTIERFFPEVNLDLVKFLSSQELSE